jgi:hypothetical protein
MREEMKSDKKWVTVLHNYKLMEDAHSESDAQNWHIVGMDLVSLNNTYFGLGKFVVFEL